MSDLIVRIGTNTAQLESGLARAEGVIGRTADHARDAFKAAASAAASLVAPLTAGVALAAVRRFADELDRLNDIRDATGASIGSLSALEDVVARAGGSFDEAASVLVKFNQVLADAKPGSEFARVFQRIGLSVEQLRAADPVEALQSTAVALSKYAADGDKARAVQELFGKSVRDAAPILNDLAEAGTLQATVTERQAQEAEAFNKALAGLRKSGTDVARNLASEVIPTVTATAQALNDSAAATAVFRSVADGVRIAFQAVAVVGANVAFVFGGVGREIAAIAAQLNALGRGDLAAFRAIGDAVKEDGRLARAELEKFEAQIMGLAPAATEVATPALQRLGTAFAATGEAAKRSAKELALFRSANEGFAGEPEARLLMLKRMQEEQDKLNQLLGITVQRQQEADLAVLDKAFFDGAISPEKYDEATRRLLGVRDTAKEAAKETRGLFTSVADGVAEAFAQASETGRLSFSNLLRDLANQLMRSQLRQLFASILGSNGLQDGLWSAWQFFGGGMATGGRPQMGRPYLVGEQGPELFVPDMSGRIVPHHQLASAAPAPTGHSVTINVTNNIDSRTDRAEVESAVTRAMRASEARVYENIRRGGSLS